MKSSPTSQFLLALKIFLFLVIAVLSSFTLHAEAFVIDGIAYYINGDGVTVSVVSHNVNGNYYPDLVEANIPETVIHEGKTYTVTAIGYAAFSGAFHLSKVVIPNTVTTINQVAFDRCQNLKTVTFGENVETIGFFAFRDCGSLESIDLPEKLKSIDLNAFYGCSGMKSLTIGKNVESIGYSAFYGCTGLKDIYSHLMNPLATTLTGDVFSSVPKTSCTLHVPIGTKVVYEACEYWNSFTNIVEDIETYNDSYALVHIYESDIALYCGRTHQLVPFVYPAGMSVNWSSSDPDIATVDENGLVKAVTTGVATITATGCRPGAISTTCQVTVNSAGNINDDVNGDGQVDIGDVNQVINMMLGKGGFSPDATQEGTCSCDVTGDGRVDISDVNQVINTMLGKPKPILRCLVNDIMINMTHVDGGTFTMGDNSSHQVTLSGYYIGQTEVTEELWLAVMGNTPPYYHGYSNNPEPISSVDWNLCQTFIAKLNELTGLNFRLPTEAEWEFAARGGNKSKSYVYSGSNNINDVAWYYIPDFDNHSPGYPQPVARKKPNELDLYDMSGNVSEWCQDWFGSYSDHEETNPTGPDSGEYRVIRGGSIFDYAVLCSTTTRDGRVPSFSIEGLGLRLAM